MFGFTGTPILAENASGSVGHQRTTKDLFGECLHRYVIVDAIKDENVLRFAVDYVGKYNRVNSGSELDIEVEAIDTRGLLDSPKRLTKIAEYILANHKNKTKHPDFTAMFCVSSVKTLIAYYEIFKELQAEVAKPLKIATIFSYAANEEDTSANGIIAEENPMIEGKVDTYSRDHLDSFIKDYNGMFKTNYSTSDSQSFYNYYQDISKRVKNGEVDILLVVNMFLTGFDSPRLNTLYVDKNLKYHGLVQAFSRTNRILNEKKSQGNIVCFRNLKEATDEAIALFSNKDAKEVVLLEPYEDYVANFNQVTEELLSLTPTVSSVDDLPDENAELAFVTKFREMLRLKNVITSFSDYKPEDLGISEQSFEDYKSKYLDIYDKVNKRAKPEEASVLEEIDFELSLIHRDEINVAYILNLLVSLEKLEPEEAKKRQKEILDLVAGDVQLRSKRKLIEEFIETTLPTLQANENVISKFETYWGEHKTSAFKQLCEEENIAPDNLEALIHTYEFAGKFPRKQAIQNALTYQPHLPDRKSILERIAIKIRDFLDTYIEGMGGST